MARAVAASAIRTARKAPGAQAMLDGEIQKFAAGVEKDLHKWEIIFSVFICSCYFYFYYYYYYHNFFFHFI